MNNLKELQLAVCLANNPMLDNERSYHTGIREIKDIKTFEEVYNEMIKEGAKEFTPDCKKDIYTKALKSKKIKIYSSYPITLGVFVTPSRMEAESYAGNKHVYSKIVNVEEVAWIDFGQGQYAKID